MDSIEFVRIRKTLKKTQKQLSELLGVSLKAVRSYEQGWRTIPVNVERLLYFLLSRTCYNADNSVLCWEVKECPEERKKNCPAWEFRSGHMCWFVNGTICEGTAQKNWQDKMKMCRSCEVLTALNSDTGETHLSTDMMLE